MGRPQAVIDWKIVDQFLVGGADGVQIAGRLGIHPNTLYERCLEENKISFSEYSQGKRSKGDALLHLAQFNKAMKGDSGMLKHLGEHRLGQKSNNKQEMKDIIEGLVHAIRSEGSSGATETQRSDVETQQPILDQRSTGEESQIPDELGTEGAL
jgi:transposase-like protein